MRLIFLSIVLQVVAQVFLKYGALNIEEYSLVSISTNIFYLLSILFLFLKAIVWQITLKNHNLNFAYLFTSLYYPILLLISYIVFRETVTLGNILGTILIAIGVIYITKRRNV